MRYVLNEEFELCGWQLLPYALMNANGDVIFLNKETYDIVSLCEGKVDFDSPLFFDYQRDNLKKICENNIIREAKDSSDIRDIKYTYYDNRYIKEVQFAITGKCNFLCKHCYMSAHSDKAIELPTAKIFYIIDEIANAGVRKISITGGECLVRKDFFQIVDRIIERKMKLTKIYSNAWLINEKLLDEFEKRKIKPMFSISFDGVGFHDYMRGVEGAEKRADEAFALLQKRGYAVDVEMCIFNKNKYTLRETIKHLDNLGVAAIKVNPVSRIGEWKKQNEDDDISIEESLKIFYDYIEYLFYDNINMRVQLSGLFSYTPGSKVYAIPCYKDYNDVDTMCVCGHARLNTYVTESGVTLPCPSLSSFDELKEKFPSILDIGFSKCISDSKYINFITTKAKEIFEHNPECKICKYKTFCYGGCRASAYSLEKDLFKKDELICIIYKNGYIEKIQNLIKKIKPNLKLVT